MIRYRDTTSWKLANPLFLAACILAIGLNLPASTADDRSTTPVGHATAIGQPGHWPQFRGPTHDLIATETDLLDAWPETGPPLLWKCNDVGSGYAAITVAGGRIFTQGYFGEEERLVAIDEKTGAAVWSVALGPVATVNFPGSRSAPTVGNNRLYAATVGGDLICFDAEGGREIWRRHLVRDFGGRMGHFGYAASPVLDGHRLICMPGSEDATIIALNPASGEVLWKGLSPTAKQASYVTPLAIQVNGMPQIVAFTSGGVTGFHGDHGTLLWNEMRSVNQNANCTTPIFHNGLLFNSSAYGAGAVLIRLSVDAQTASAELVYHTFQMKNHHGGFVLVDGHIYGANDSVWTCLDLLTGKVFWKHRGVGKGSIVYADRHLYLRGEDGRVALVKAVPDGYRESGRFTPPHRSDKNAWAYPVVAGGRLYLRDQEVLLAYNVQQPSGP